MNSDISLYKFTISNREATELSGAGSKEICFKELITPDHFACSFVIEVTLKEEFGPDPQVQKWHLRPHYNFIKCDNSKAFIPRCFRFTVPQGNRLFLKLISSSNKQPVVATLSYYLSDNRTY